LTGGIKRGGRVSRTTEKHSFWLQWEEKDCGQRGGRQNERGEECVKQGRRNGKSSEKISPQQVPSREREEINRTNAGGARGVRKMGKAGGGDFFLE